MQNVSSTRVSNGHNILGSIFDPSLFLLLCNNPIDIKKNSDNKTDSIKIKNTEYKYYPSSEFDPKQICPLVEYLNVTLCKNEEHNFETIDNNVHANDSDEVKKLIKEIKLLILSIY